MRGQNLLQLWKDLGPADCTRQLNEAMRTRQIRPEQFSIREIAESFCGKAWADRFNPGTSGYQSMDIMEAGDGVDVTAFAHITGQIFFNKILEGWENAQRIADKLFTNFPTKLDGERLPWIGHAISEGEEIHPGMPYTETSFGERYVDTPRTKKMGQIISLTKEAIFFDHTGQMLKGSAELGERLAYNKERLQLRTVLGIDNTYQLNGNSANTYQLTAGSSPNQYINAMTGVPLIDWTSVQNYYILASKILDPDTNEPIITKPSAMLVMPANYITAKRIMTATGVRSTFPGIADGNVGAPGNVQMITDNPLPDILEVHTSSIAYQLLVNPPAGSGFTALSAPAANQFWLIGDFKKSFYWMENWPLQIEQAPVGNIRQFEQDVMMRWKASFRGTAAIIEPRYMQRFMDQTV